MRRKPIFSVFLSSTKQDLAAYRSKAKEVCERLDLFPIGMEDFGAMNAGATAGSQSRVEDADVFVGIYAHRYGYIESGSDLSVTEREFDHALALGKPVLAFVVDPEYAWDGQLRQQDAADKLERFKQKVQSARIVAFFTSPDNFDAQLTRALVKWSDDIRSRPGNGKPNKVFQIPRELSPHFTGRAEIPNLIRERLVAGNNAAFAQTQVLTGEGGIGKTETAIAYATHFREDYAHIFWVLADSDAEIRSGLARIAATLGLAIESAKSSLTEDSKGGGWRNLDVTAESSRDQQQAVATALQWLAANNDWLLVFDNADDPQVLSAYRPRNAHGHVLITSRVQRFPDFDVDRPIVLDFLPASDAVELLLRCSKRDESADESERLAAAELARELDGLPIAIEQAARFLDFSPDVRIAEYLAEFRHDRLGVLEQLHEAPSRRYPLSVAKAWLKNLELVARESPGSHDLLRFAAFLHPDEITHRLIHRAGPDVSDALRGAVADKPEAAVRQLLPALVNRSLIRTSRTRPAFSLHRLLQDVLRDLMDAATQQDWAQRAILALAAVFPKPEYANWDECELLLPHALAIARLAEPDGPAWTADADLQERLAEFLHRTAAYLRERGRYQDALPLAQRSLDIREQCFGGEHLVTAASLSLMGRLRLDQAQYPLAESLLQRVLRIRQSQLPDNHADLGETYNDLGLLCYDNDRFEEAEGHYLHALGIRQATLGGQHPDFAVTLSYLALLYQTHRGDLSKAEAFYKQALAIREAALNEEHPDIAESLNNLAVFYDALKQFREMEPLLVRAKRIWEKAKHPNLATVLHNLGNLYVNLSQFEDAEQHYQQALRITVASVGEDHPQVASTREALGWFYFGRCKYDMAREEFERALRIRRQRGSENLGLAATLDGLGALAQERRDFPQAADYYQQALELRQRYLANDHPEIAVGLKNVGVALHWMQRYEEARPYYQEALRIREAKFGPPHPLHPSVAESLDDLAGLHQNLQEYETSESLYQQALRIREQIHATELSHPEVAISKQNLGLLYEAWGDKAKAKTFLREAMAMRQESERVDPRVLGETFRFVGAYEHRLGNYAEAEEQFRSALEKQRSILPSDHPDLAVTLENLGLACSAQNRFQEGRDWMQQALTIRQQALGQRDPLTAQTIHNLAGVTTGLRDFATAESLYREALELRQSQDEPNGAAVAQTARELGELYHRQNRLNEAERCYEQALTLLKESDVEDDPATAAVLNDLGVLYGARNDFAKMEEFVTAALNIRTAAFGEDDVIVAASLFSLAQLRAAEGDHAEAESLHRRVLEIRQKKFGDQSLAVAESLHNLAQVIHVQHRFDEAVPLYQQSLEIREHTLGAEHPDVAQSLHNLGALLSVSGRDSEAEPLLTRSLSIRESSAEAEQAVTADTREFLGALYYRTGRFDQAMHCYRRSLAIRETHLDPHDVKIAKTASDLAVILHRQSNYGEAETLYQRALAIREEMLGSESPAVTETIINLAELNRAQGKFAAVEALCRRSLAIYEAQADRNPAAIIRSLAALADACHQQSKPVEAERFHRRALEEREALLPATHSDIASSCNYIGNCLYAQNRFVEAEPLYRRALQIWDDNGESLNALVCLKNLALVWTEQAKHADAEQCYRRVVEITRSQRGEDHLELADALINLATSVQSQSRLQDAIDLQEQALVIRTKALGTHAPLVGAVVTRIQLLLRSLGEFDRSEPLAKRGIEIYEKAYGHDNRDVATCYSNLGYLHVDQGRFSEAETAFREALEITERIAPGDASKALPLWRELANACRRQRKWDETAGWLNRLLAEHERVSGTDSLEAARLWHELGLLYHDQQDFPKAEQAYGRALDIRQAQLSPSHQDVLVSLNDLAVLYQDSERGDDAVALYLRVIDRLHSADNKLPSLHATTLNNLARLHASRKQYAEAASEYRRVLEIRERTLSADDPQIESCLISLGDMLDKTQSFDEAETVYQRILADRRRRFGDDDLRVADWRYELADFYRSRDKLDEAAAEYRSSVAVRRRLLPPSDLKTGFACFRLARILQQLAKRDGIQQPGAVAGEVESLYRESLGCLEQTPGRGADVLDCAFTLAELLQEQHRYQDADDCYQRALAASRETFGENHLETSNVYNALGLMYRLWGRSEQAIEAHLKALTIRTAADPPQPFLEGVSRFNLAYVNHTLWRFAEAEEQYLGARRVLESAFAADHADVLWVHRHLAELYEQQLRWTDAEPLLRQMALAYDRPAEPRSRDYADAASRLARALYELGHMQESEQWCRNIIAARPFDAPLTVIDASAFYHLALSLDAQQRMQEAHDAYVQSLDVYRQLFGREDDRTYDVVWQLAGFLKRHGRKRDARQLLNQWELEPADVPSADVGRFARLRRLIWSCFNIFRDRS